MVIDGSSRRFGSTTRGKVRHEPTRTRSASKAVDAFRRPLAVYLRDALEWPIIPSVFVKPKQGYPL
jgi:hypothetical protein